MQVVPTPASLPVSERFSLRSMRLAKVEAGAAPVIEPGQQPSAKLVAAAEVAASKPAAKEDTAGGDNQTTEEINEAMATRIFAHVASKARSSWTIRPQCQTHEPAFVPARMASAPLPPRRVSAPKYTQSCVERLPPSLLIPPDT